MSDTSAMAEAGALSRLQLTSLPPEILDLILQAYVDDYDSDKNTNNVLSAMTTSRLLHDILLPKLYASIRIHSAKQMYTFSSRGSRARSEASHHSRSVVINIPGVPGETRDRESRWAWCSLQPDLRRLKFAGDVLLHCDKARSVSFEFFSARLGLDQEDAPYLTKAFRCLSKLERFRWVPPQRDGNAIKGFSIVIIDPFVVPIARGVEEWSRLQWLELWNIMLPENGGHELAQALIRLSTERARQGVKLDLEILLRSIIHLDPNVIADLALAHPPIKVNVADGFVDSIWGDRVTEQVVEQCVRRKLKSDSCASIANGPGSMPLSIEQRVADAMKNVCITMLKDGVAGSQESTQSTD